MKKLIYIIGILTIVVIAGLFIFKAVVPNDTKREIMEEMGLDDSPLNELAKESFIDYELIDSRPNLMGNKWVVRILLENSNPDINIYKVTIRYRFGDGDETRSYDVDLRPKRMLPAYIDDKISGHKGEELLGIEIVDAE